MKTAWTKHLKTEEEKDKFRSHVLGSKTILERINDLADEELSGLENAELNVKIYDLPNWDYRQAHANGFRACMRWLKTLTNLDQGLKHE
jgi:hypothetical protein